jgi:flagellar hook-associated protein 3 FlgL
MNIHLSPSTQQFLDRLADTTRRMERAQNQISSGKKITSASDDPDQVSTLLQTRAELESCQQVEKNLGRVKTEVDTAEQALTAADQLLQDARSAAAQGASTTVTQETRNILAGQIQSMMEHMASIANTSVEGRYVFSGDSDSSPAFALDFTQTPPYGAYLGSASSRQVLTSDGSTFIASLSGGTLFDAPGNSVFGALDQLRTALLSGVDTNITAASQNLSSVEDYLGTQHAAYGAVQTRVNSAVNVASKREVTLKTQVGNIEDADLSTAIVEFTKASTDRNAALQAQAQMPRKSLFDYLG